MSFSWVSLDGLKTNTPELKQSGQPGSGAADNSSLSKSSSMLDSTWMHKYRCIKNHLWKRERFEKEKYFRCPLCLYIATKKEPVLCGFCAVNRSLSHQCVSVHEHTLAVLRERPAVQFGERHPQVRTLHQGQMSWIAWIHHVHHMHLIKNGAQHISIEQTVWFTSACMSPLILR